MASAKWQQSSKAQPENGFSIEPLAKKARRNIREESERNINRKVAISISAERQRSAMA
jgi:hypothetical protein